MSRSRPSQSTVAARTAWRAAAEKINHGQRLELCYTGDLVSQAEALLLAAQILRAAELADADARRAEVV